MQKPQAKSELAMVGQWSMNIDQPLVIVVISIKNPCGQLVGSGFKVLEKALSREGGGWSML